ncbi:MAG TPA: cupredoxin family protein [Casimicrobiaceae bacterium]|nr:cupredoxin family protein [Casimicrobiaceae bacterium]
MKRIAMAAAAAFLTGSLAQAHGDTTAHGNTAHAGHGAATADEAQKPWGVAGNPKAVARTIEITTRDDMRFSPSAIRIAQGETVRLIVRNDGKLMHELVIGTKKDLDSHAAAMAKSQAMTHEEPYMTHVAPGEAGEIVWTFNRPGKFDFACLVAGHYEAGMRGRIDVAPAAK